MTVSHQHGTVVIELTPYEAVLLELTLMGRLDEAAKDLAWRLRNHLRKVGE